MYVFGGVGFGKAPEGATTNCVERNLRKVTDHLSCNIAIDSFRMKDIRDQSIRSFLTRRLQEGHGIKRLIFVNCKSDYMFLCFWCITPKHKRRQEALSLYDSLMTQQYIFVVKNPRVNLVGNFYSKHKLTSLSM